MTKKTLYFDSFCGYTVFATVERGELTDFKFEKGNGGNVIGNVYKGRVVSVLPGMQAAFIDCGLERNCYLSADNLSFDAQSFNDERGGKPALTLNEGDEILVQVVKSPFGNKGAKVTADLSFVGKNVIYLPNTPFTGISHKIDDEELKKSLAYTAEKIKSSGDGIILRTHAPYATREQLESEYGYLKEKYENVKRKAENAAVGELLYADFNLPLRVLRDVNIAEVGEIIVGNAELHAQIEQKIKLHPDRLAFNIKLYEGADMLRETGIAEQIYAFSSPRVDLESGAYLIFEKTEALTVIDVNTGKFTGDDSLEQTVYCTNVSAAREIARQVRLRNIGGIIVVDFIDMRSKAHQKALVEELERALSGDSAKCTVAQMSEFGLVEFTRKRTGNGVLSQVTKVCRHCKGFGRTPTALTVLFKLRSKLIEIFAGGAKSCRVDMNAEMLSVLISNREVTDEFARIAGDGTLYAVPHKTYYDDKLEFRMEEFEIPADAVKIK